MEKAEIEVLNQEGEVIENSNLLKLEHPIVFEGKTYEELDLRNIETIRGKDMIEVRRLFRKSGFSAVPEMDLEYNFLMASRITKLPYELFEQLYPTDSIELNNRMTAFFYGKE